MKKILHYDVGEKLGEGKNGPCYLAWDAGHDRAVVIKILERGLVRDELRQIALRDEAARVNSIGSDRQANFFSLENFDSQQVVVREYVQGKSLKQAANEGPVEFNQFLNIAVEATRALMDLQARHMVHRNINSSNVIHAKEGLVKLVDFHLNTSDLSALSAADITHLAPEQLESGETSHLGDLYSLGVVFYQLLTGSLPYASVETASLKKAILSGRNLFPDTESDRYPGDARLLVETMMAVDPRDRFAGADTLLLTLREMLHLDREQVEVEIEKTAKFTSRQYLGVSLLVLMFVILWFVLSIYNR